MACSHCGTESTIATAVPDDYREYAPDSAAAVTICPTCLTVDPAPSAAANDDGDGEDPDFSRLSDAFPRRPDRAVPLALAIERCDSLATNREAIETLLRAVERAGTDPLLVVDRLVADPSIEPAIDLDRRRHQLEQLLY
ncbi:DUF6276 family protein [Halosolutus amylolyticus]|uniref:DUF6276 family protein n=1 Tax=Halosolutus amylolyticus TaxID=2932267 RepID=A0ABD5PR08_9EURY|nr:DUF6276 family protein [Halosolutus amylolyticus]